MKDDNHRPQDGGAGAWEDSAGMTVGAAAGLLGISVRTLHHWDAIGLVKPSGRSLSGYRLYSQDDVSRLQRALVYRATGMPLARVKEALDETGMDARAHLARQRELLEERIARLARMVRAVDTMMEAMMEREDTGMALTVQEQAEIWGDDWDPAYAEEAEQRWGETEDWAESARRQARMSKADWMEAHEATESLEAGLAEAFVRGVTPGSAQANALAERHRAELNRWFEVTVAKQVIIARGYVGDERFARHYDRRAEGLAAWLKEIIDANALAQGVDPAAAQWG
ncbi:MerR family transcriptional regulator [Actinomyces capricornis]|nr:MerR family transcriptional regulator [Actinomyces capricornis]